MKRFNLVTLLMVIALILVACGGADPTPTPEPEPTEAAAAEPTPEPTEEMMEEEVASNSIVDIAVADGRFTTLVAAVEAAGLAETLSSEGPFTVFAPTDDAFAALPEGTVDTLLEDPTGDLTDILLYHVVEGAVPSSDVVNLDSATTLLGEDVTVEVVDGAVILNGEAEVVITDIEADNGIIHVIDTVLLPPSEEMAEEEMTEIGSIVDIAVEDGRFTTLVAAVEAAGLAETLSSEGSYTVFAPTDDAFAALPEGTIDDLLEDPQGALTDILLYHVVEGEVPASDVVTLESATTLLGEDITIEIVGEDVVLNGIAEVIITDIQASNGIIHVIDAVLMPPSGEEMGEEETMEMGSIVDIAVEDGRFTTLVAALEAAGLVETLSGEGEFTVFAPTDDAFAALPEGTIEALLADPQGDLTNILLYHVIEGIVLAEDVVELEAATTLLGEDITITVTEDGNVILNDTVMVIITDIQASNGVIHVIDAVLIPPSVS